VPICDGCQVGVDRNNVACGQQINPSFMSRKSAEENGLNIVELITGLESEVDPHVHQSKDDK
jgi:hypothetical protein